MTFVFASVGPPKAKLEDEATSPASSKTPPANHDDPKADVQSLSDSASLLTLVNDTDHSTVPGAKLQEYLKGPAGKECRDMTVSFGTDNNVSFISPLCGFRMTVPRRGSKTLFDTHYKDTKLKIRRYYFTAEGHELGIHEDESGSPGWVWLPVDQKSKDLYAGLLNWLTDVHNKFPDTFCETTISFGKPGTFWAYSGARYFYRGLPETLLKAVSLRKSEPTNEPPVGADGKPLSEDDRKLPYIQGPKVLALGAEDTYFVLWPNGAYQFNLHSSNLLVKKIRNESSEKIRSVTSLSLSPVDCSEYWLVFRNGASVGHTMKNKSLDLSSCFFAHCRAWYDKYPEIKQAMKPSHQESSKPLSDNGSENVVQGKEIKEDGAEKARASTSEVRDGGPAGGGERQRRRFSLFRLGKKDGKENSKTSNIKFGETISHPA